MTFLRRQPARACPGANGNGQNGVVLDAATVARQGRRILGPLTLALTEPRIGVVGRNGSGKSTLARLMCGLIAPDSGTAQVYGTDIARDRKAAIRAVGLLFQNPDHQIIFPTVGEEVAFGLTQLGASKAAAREGAHAALARFGKRHWAERSVHTLSQGQRHLVCLMAVLAMAPRLIVLDEPFAGLDIPTTRALNRYLDGLEQQIILITHDPPMLGGVNRVIWLERGDVAGDGPPGHVLPAFHAGMETDDDCPDLAD